MPAKTPDQLPSFVDLMLDAVFLVDVHGKVMYVSAACEPIFGYTQDEMIGRQLFDFLYHEDRERTLEEAARVMEGRGRVGFENRYVRKDGSLVNIMWSARWSESDQMRIGVARDVTGMKSAEALQSAMYAISEAVHAAKDLHMLCDEIHRIISKLVPMADFAIAVRDDAATPIRFPFQANPDIAFPLAQDPLARQLCEDVIHRLQGNLLVVPSPAALREQDVSLLSVPLVSRKRAIGAVIMKSLPGTIYREQDKELMLFVSEQIAVAIERKRLQDKLQRMAQYDELTGLPNRRLLKDRMEMALARTRRSQSSMAVLYIDMDNFKMVNDSLGHAAGDLLLKEVAGRLQQCMRASDTVARIGGDEFVVLLEHIFSVEDVRAVADKIRNAVSEKMLIDDTAISVLASVGFALYPDHGNDLEQLLRHADKSMYSAKRVKTSV
jgi:diguanylate cyclase (GGDEF)-like protein/PAS domain S-box-containing protein